MFNAIRQFICQSLILYSFLSCTPKKTNEILLQEINDGLTQSNLVIGSDAKNTLEMFKMKLADPITKTKAEYFYPKLSRLVQATEELKKYIDSLKMQITKAGNSVSTNYTQENKSLNSLLIANDEYKNLYKRLKHYRENILLPDSMSLGELTKYCVIISKDQDTVNNESFLRQCFADASVIEAITYLNRLQNNISIVESKCIKHYNESVRDHIDWFNSYSSIVAQSAKVLKAGDDLEISGGVGVFSKERLLEFSVNGKQIPTNEKGIANYKFKTSNKPGIYSIPVLIRMLGEDSIEQKLNFSVEYSLVDVVKKH
jgi:hypothetical protein